jgi:glycerol-3-phosphate dehydrogenase
MSTRNRICVDVAIVGGGIAGLWLANLLRGRGYSTVLIERSTFGDGQTIRSQGMIHGGLKYALGGVLTGASESIAAMPARWRDCLRGTGEIDLLGVRVLSERYYLWSANDSTLGRIAGFLASKVLRGRARRLERGEYPAAFAGHDFRGVVYELDELVIDTPSLLTQLAQAQCGHTVSGMVGAEHLQMRDDGSLASIRLPDCEITAERFVLTAGAGNEALLKALAIHEPATQRRPLHQLMVRRAGLPPLYGHCVAPLTGSEPRLTVTTHTDHSGERVWYVGGQIASDGVTRTDAEQARHAQTELTACLPWLDLADAQFESLHVDRAEPQQHGGRRPDAAFVAATGNVLACWPTKLTLAPDLGDKVLAALNCVPSHRAVADIPDRLTHPGVAVPPWNR